MRNENRTNRLCGWTSRRQSNPSNDNKRNCADSRNRTANREKTNRVSGNVPILLPSRFHFVGVGLAEPFPTVASIGGILVFFVTIVMYESFHYWYFSLSDSLLNASSGCLAWIASAQDFYKSTDSIFGCGPHLLSSWNFNEFPFQDSENELIRLCDKSWASLGLPLPTVWLWESLIILIRLGIRQYK